MFIRETIEVKRSGVLWPAAMRTEDHTAQPRTVGTKTALTYAFVLAAALARLTAGLGYLDGPGLFAPDNWVDAGAFPGSAASPAASTSSRRARRAVSPQAGRS